MTYVIVGSCIKDDSCIEVCPVDCIHPKPGAADFETAEQLYIDPEVCIDCDACVEACPVDAIFPDFDIPGEVRLRARPQRGVLRRPGHRRADRGVMARARPRVAIVGAGPAGAFAAAALLRANGDTDIDLIERLPTPWGLLRGGVAPDHQEIKRLEDTFDRQTLRHGCRFLGNVEVGVDVSHDELMRHYDAVVYATGAQTDKSLGIPGEDLPGSWAATEFVGWYNGHPDFRDLEFDLSGERAVVIGNGNVAADVTRILMLSPAELERTDVADHALAALRESRIREVVVLGRRGPAQAAFTSAELRELGRMDGVDMRVDPAEVELDPVSREWLDEDGTFTARKNVELLREFAARPARTDAERRIELRFLRSPVEIRGDGRVEAVDVAPQRDRARRRTARCAPAPPATTSRRSPCGLVLRSVGYRAVPLPGVPFEERRFVLPNERGRVHTPDGTPLPGVYAVGWIKRGPTGILGTNKRDAEETMACLVEDLANGALAPAGDDRETIDALLAERGVDVVTVEGWRTIDRQELATRPRRAAPAREARVARRAARRGARRPARVGGARSGPPAPVPRPLRTPAPTAPAAPRSARPRTRRAPRRARRRSAGGGRAGAGSSVRVVDDDERVRRAGPPASRRTSRPSCRP